LNLRTFSAALICSSIALSFQCAGYDGAFAQTKAPAKSKPQPNQAHPAHPNNAALQTAVNAYLDRLRPKLYRNWLIPDGNNNVKIVATLDPSGTTDGVQVTSSPKNDPAEQAASDAFSKAQPLESLPGGLQKAKLELDFISKADPHGDSSSNINTTLIQVQADKPAAAAPASH